MARDRRHPDIAGITAKARRGVMTGTGTLPFAASGPI
jgi:hypothetical protein